MALAERMATSPKDALEHLVQVALELCCAQSAGISLAEENDGRPVFRWRAAAGRFAVLVGTGMPQEVSPSALVLERGEPTLFCVPRQAPLDASSPGLEEALLVPLQVPGGPSGTLWVVSHDETCRFDREDARLLASLARFAALGLRTLSLLGDETSARRDAQQAVAALRESEQRFGKFMQRLPGLAWIKDLDGRYVFVNDAAEQAFRRPRSELLGRTDAEIFPPDVAAQFRENDAGALASGSGIETIETLEHGDGVHHSIVSKFPIPGPGGEPSLIGGVAIDITARIQAEEVIRESEERFRTMADNTPACIYTTQPDGYCTFLSSAWTTLTGKSIEAGLGFGWGDAVHPDDLELTKGVFAADPPATFRIEFRLAARGGGHHWVIGTGAPRHGKDGVFRGYVGSVLDVDKEKRTEDALRNSVQLYRAIGESIDYGVWVCDPSGRNVYASQSFLNLVGLTQEECSDFGWSRALHPDDVERTRLFWQETVRSGASWDIEHRFRGVDGQWHPVLARGVPVKNERGETTAWAGINLDISRLKQVEDELREVDRRKDEFLATLAHELRNPLAPIRNSLHVLRLERDSAQSAHVHEMIERQVNHLIRLVDDLLEVARITSGKIELRRERIELAEVVRAALETSRPAIERAEHRLEVAVPAQGLTVDGDGVRLAQVVGNLLNNAAKYTEERGTHLALRAPRGPLGCVLGARHRSGNPARDAAARIRPLHAGRPHPRPVAGRTRHRSRPGEAPRRDARRAGRGAERRAGSGQRVHDTASAGAGARGHGGERRGLSLPGGERPRSPQVPRRRRQPRRGRQPRDAAAAAGRRGARRLRRGRRRSTRRARRGRTSCCSTSACREWTASRSRRACARTSSSGTPCWSRSRAGASRSTAARRPRQASTATW